MRLPRVDTPARELFARAPEQAGDIVARAELNLREGLALHRGLAHAHDEGVLRARQAGGRRGVRAGRARAAQEGLLL